MARLKKVLLVLLGLAALLGAAGVVFQKPIAMLLLQKVAEKNVGRNILETLPDGLHVGLCGTGSPFPDPTRAGPCTAVIAGKRLFIVDAGEGGARTLGYMGIPASKIEAILLTHFHSDHIDGLGPLLLQRWGTGTMAAPTPIYGPPGVDRVVEGFRMAYGQDTGYRVAHHSEAIMPPGGAGGKGVTFTLQGDTAVLLNDGGLKITAFRVDHGPVEPAVGYRFDYQGRAVVISGDTKKTDGLVAAAKGADLLVHEALQPKMVKLIEDQFNAKNLPNVGHIMHDILNYHTTPEEAAQQAAAAGVQQLVFNHIVPPLPIKYAYPAFVADARDFFQGPITVGEDGMLFSLPAGSKDIRQSQLKP